MNKGPKTLIKEYYASHGMTHRATLLFSYVRAKKDGGAVIEYYAARYGKMRRRRGNRVCSKLVMKFNPDTGWCSWSDSVYRYTSWSLASIDHLIYDFRKEMTGFVGLRGQPVTYGRMTRCYGWEREVMPTSEIPLNGFEGTKYQYCKYRYKDERTCASNVHSYSYWARNPFGPLPDYLRTFNVNPHAVEMFASVGMTKYMREDFLVRLRDDEPFARWYRSHAKSMLGDSIRSIYAAARRDIGVTPWLADDSFRRAEEKRRRIAKMRRERREELRRAEIIKERNANERKERASRIRELYTRLKSICVMFGAYEVVVPKTEREMKAEGKKMHNCVGECYPCRQGIDAVVVFLHKDGKPCVDVEIDPFTFKIVQCRTVCNREADAGAWRVAKDVSKEMRKLLTKAA